MRPLGEATVQVKDYRRAVTYAERALQRDQREEMPPCFRSRLREVMAVDAANRGLRELRGTEPVQFERNPGSALENGNPLNMSRSLSIALSRAPDVAPDIGARRCECPFCAIHSTVIHADPAEAICPNCLTVGLIPVKFKPSNSSLGPARRSFAA